MPTYEYHCEANGCTVEVQHKMADRVQSWGELCERAGIAPGATDPHAPVRKLMSAGFIATGRAGAAESACDPVGCESAACGGGMCALQ